MTLTDADIRSLQDVVRSAALEDPTRSLILTLGDLILEARAERDKLKTDLEQATTERDILKARLGTAEEDLGAAVFEREQACKDAVLAHSLITRVPVGLHDYAYEEMVRRVGLYKAEQEEEKP